MERTKKDEDTRKKLLDSAKAHFLEHGFRAASLNQIIKETGFTKGAFYFYFRSKEEIFDALVGETAAGIEKILSEESSEWGVYDRSERAFHMVSAHLGHLPELVDLLQANKDEARLLLTCAEGTRYENYLGRLKEADESAGNENLKNAFGESPIDADTYDVLMSGYYAMIGQIVLSGASRDEMLQRMTDIQLVYESGIAGLIREKTLKD